MKIVNVLLSCVLMIAVVSGCSSTPQHTKNSKAAITQSVVPAIQAAKDACFTGELTGFVFVDQQVALKFDCSTNKLREQVFND